jgi:deoxycytidine triphosphate deaminase
MRWILHERTRIERLSPDEVPEFFERWADPTDDELDLVKSWRAGADANAVRRARSEVERRIDVLHGLLARLDEDGRPRMRRYLGCRLIDQLLRTGELSISPFDPMLVHNDSVDCRFGPTVWVPRPGRRLRPATATLRDFVDSHHRIDLREGEPYPLAPGQVINVAMLETITLSKRYGLELENTSREARLHVRTVLAPRLHAGHAGGVMLEVQNVGVAVREIYAGDVGVQAFVYEVEGACSEHRPNAMPFQEPRTAAGPARHEHVRECVARR